MSQTRPPDLSVAARREHIGQAGQGQQPMGSPSVGFTLKMCMDQKLAACWAETPGTNPR
jgi:hypothetical protein